MYICSNGTLPVLSILLVYLIWPDTPESGYHLLAALLSCSPGTKVLHKALLMICSTNLKQASGGLKVSRVCRSLGICESSSRGVL